MDTQVTQKKKLTLRAQKPDLGPDAGAGATADAPAEVAVARPAIDSRYHTPAAIIAIVASVIFLTLLALQAMEWAYYQAPPTVWPPPVAGAAR